MIYTEHGESYRSIGGLKMSRKNGNKLLGVGVIVGVLTGAAAAYFYAPQDGKRTKAMLAKRFNNVTQESIIKVQTALIQLEQKLEDR